MIAFAKTPLIAGVISLAIVALPLNGAVACQIVSVLTGSMRLDRPTHAADPVDEDSIVIMGNYARDSDGTLKRVIKAELWPERWGFDVHLPDGGEWIGQIFTLRNGLEIASATDESSCDPHRLALRFEKSPTKVSVIDNGKRIGVITNFPHRWLKP